MAVRLGLRRHAISRISVAWISESRLRRRTALRWRSDRVTLGSRPRRSLREHEHRSDTTGCDPDGRSTSRSPTAFSRGQGDPCRHLRRDSLLNTTDLRDRSTRATARRLRPGARRVASPRTRQTANDRAGVWSGGGEAMSSGLRDGGAATDSAGMRRSDRWPGAATRRAERTHPWTAIHVRRATSNRRDPPRHSTRAPPMPRLCGRPDPLPSRSRRAHTHERSRRRAWQ